VPESASLSKPTGTSCYALVNQRRTARGGLEVQQAANQLTALAVKQHFPLQTMMAAQYRIGAIWLERIDAHIKAMIAVLNTCAEQ
jgi:conjugal transfer/entry exclusion protein